MPKQPYNCAHCGTEFYDWPSNRTGHGAYFCNRQCQRAWQAAFRVGPNSPSWKGGPKTVTTSCGQCGKSLEIEEKHYRRFSGKHYCNRKCRSLKIGAERSGENNNKWRGGDVALICAECATPFTRSRRSFNKQASHHFCSRKCKGEWMSKHLVGAHAARWTGGKVEYYGPNWLRQSRAARKRDTHRCRLCGSSKGQRGKALDVHHIRPFKSFGYIPGKNDNHLAANDLDNLLTVCPTCHKVLENGIADLASLQP